MTNAQEKVRYSDQELAEFKSLIEKKLSKAKEEYAFYASQIFDAALSADAKIKSLDDGVGASENEMLSSMAVRQKQYIQRLENALQRIENKVYGICRATGRLIAKDRLKAVPHATLSFEAKLKGLG